MEPPDTLLGPKTVDRSFFIPIYFFIMSKAYSMDTIVSLAKRRGFVFPGSDIYGGLANSWDYGPLGAQMRVNLKRVWWKMFVESRDDVVGFDGAIFMNPRVWEASGHVDTFHDPLVEDVVTRKRYRADDLILAHTEMDISGMDAGRLSQVIVDLGITSPDGNPLSEVKTFNLMFQTQMGVVEGDTNTIYLRPETAQSMFVNFKHIAQTTRKRLPFGIAQIGKAFRNEITPGNFIFRTLEFEQMEIEYFVEESEWQSLFDAWLSDMRAFGRAIGIADDLVHEYEVPEADRAHYSARTVDIEFDFPFGRKELWGLAYRGDYDLTQHQNISKQSLEYTDPDDNKRKFLPHVIEPSLGVDRTLLAILVSAYTEEVIDGETRVVLRLSPAIAPYQVAVLPLMKKDGLSDRARDIHRTLLTHFRSEYDESGSVGKRYRRHDEIGTPYCITVDYDTAEDGCVTVRDRDTMKQERVPVDTLITYFSTKLI